MAIIYAQVSDEFHATLSGVSTRLKRSMASVIEEIMTPALAELARSEQVEAASKLSQAEYESAVNRLVQLAREKQAETAPPKRSR